MLKWTLFLGLTTLFSPASCDSYGEVVNFSIERPANAGNKLICYYTATSYFPVNQVPADKCTHIIYAFGLITPTGILPKTSKDLQVYKALIQLKQKNPNLKILLSLQSDFKSVVNAGTSVMKRFSQAAVKFLSDNGFDGVDLDWEFPSSSDKDNYKQFIEIFQAETSRANMLMSAALPNNPYRFKGFDAACLSKCMDFMTAMTYDYHLFVKGKDTTTGYNSPLYTPKGEIKYLSTSATLTFYLNQGIPANKLLMGIPFYGRSWTLASPSKHDLHAPAVGKGAPGPYRKYKGVYTYPDVCVAQQQGANYVLDDVNGAAYLYDQNTWVAYEGKHTVAKKLSWLKSQNFGGVGIWALHLDDNAGVCGSGNLPLLNAVKSNL